MANNDIHPYFVEESVAADDMAATVYTAGVEIEKQATRMGLLVVVTEEDTVDGTYTIIVQTADRDEDSSGAWLSNTLDSISFNAAGTYHVELAQPVVDKVRAKITATGATPEAVSLVLTWLSDTPITSLE